MAVTITSISQVGNSDIIKKVEVLLTADTDVGIVDLPKSFIEHKGYTWGAVSSKGIAADEIKVYASIQNSDDDTVVPTAEYFQLFDAAGSNPFQAGNFLHNFTAANIGSFKVERFGGVDGDITMTISFSTV